jgi:hypothetical protein
MGDWIKGVQDVTLVHVYVNAATSTTWADGIRRAAARVSVLLARVVVRVAVAAGLAAAGWGLMLVVGSAAASADEPSLSLGSVERPASASPAQPARSGNSAEPGSEDESVSRGAATKEATTAATSASRPGLLGGVIGGLAQTTSHIANSAVDTVKQTTGAVTKTVHDTVKQVSETVNAVTGGVRDTVGNVIRPGSGIGDIIDPAPSIPVVQPVVTVPIKPQTPPATSSVRTVTKKAVTTSERPEAKKPQSSERSPARAERHDDRAPAAGMADLARSAGSASTGSALSSQDGAVGAMEKQMPSTPCGASSPTVAHADAPSKKLLGVVATTTASNPLHRIGAVAVAPESRAVMTAALPCTSPD